MARIIREERQASVAHAEWDYTDIWYGCCDRIAYPISARGVVQLPRSGLHS